MELQLPTQIKIELPPPMPPPSPSNSPRPPMPPPSPARWVDLGYPTARWINGAYQNPTRWSNRTLLTKHIRNITY